MIDHARFLEFQPQIVAFAGALAHAGKYRHAAVLHRQVVDELLNDDGLAHARAAEQPDLAAAQIGLDQIDDLDARLEHLQFGGLILERRRRAMNGIKFMGVHRPHLIHRLADHVEYAAQGFLAHRHLNRTAQADGFHAAHQAFRGLQRDGAHAPLADMLLDFAYDIDRLRHVEAFAHNANGGV